MIQEAGFNPYFAPEIAGYLAQKRARSNFYAIQDELRRIQQFVVILSTTGRKRTQRATGARSKQTLPNNNWPKFLDWMI